MVSVVNGYVCFSSCDAAEAKQGKDPNARPNTLPGTPDIKKKSAFGGQPAAILDGALKKSANGTSLASAADVANDATRRLLVDILA